MARAFLLLHGFTGSESSWANLVPQAKPDLVLTPALSGHDGRSGAPGVNGFDDELDRLAALVRGAGLSEVHVAGYSLGARIALGLLVRHRELFTSATLIGVHPGLETENERIERIANDEAWCRMLESEGVLAFVSAWQKQALFATQSRLSAEILARQEQDRLKHDARGLIHSLRCLGLGRMPNFRPALPTLDIPIKILVGGLDAKFSALARGMAALLPRASVTEVGGVGHNVLLERPDIVVDAIPQARAA